MNRIKSFLPWILGLVWLGIRVLGATVLFKDNPDAGRSLGVITNLSFIIILIFIELRGIYRAKRRGQQSGFMADFKVAASATIKYAVMVGMCIFAYYNFISDELEVKKKQDYTLTIEALDTDEELNKIKAENDQLAHLSREQIIEVANSRTDLFTNPRIVSSASFIVLVFVGLLYSI
ncbi:MAG: DUF4199 family protein [Flavobacteriales bacterium]